MIENVFQFAQFRSTIHYYKGKKETCTIVLANGGATEGKHKRRWSMNDGFPTVALVAFPIQLVNI